jgi:hypothetical protein
VKGTAPDYPAARRSGDLLKHQCFKNLSLIGFEVCSRLRDCFLFGRCGVVIDELHLPAGRNINMMQGEPVVVGRWWSCHCPNRNPDHHGADHGRYRNLLLLTHHAP